jgi:mannose-6-phosphate isomerase-like protein (cupin superfamily)
MKLALALALLGMSLTIGVLAAAQSGNSGVIRVEPEKVAAALAKGGNLITAPNVSVSGVHRVTAGQVAVHDKETEVLYFLDGEATLVTGGKIVGGTVSRPGQWVGTDITGGQTHHVAKGDVFMIPAGVPHWYKEIPRSITYFEVHMIEK